MFRYFGVCVYFLSYCFHINESFQFSNRLSTLRPKFINMNMFQFFQNMNDNSDNSINLSNIVDLSPPWSDIDTLLRSKEVDSEKQLNLDILSGRGRSTSKANIRLFSAPDGTIPEIILYRDSAAWCPYCEKVWLLLEEKKIPYRIEKVPLRCYGEKPRSFLQINPQGMLPVANIKGRVISESNDIMQAIEDEFPSYSPLLPPASDPKSSLVTPLLRLERKVFSFWFSWLTNRSRSGQGDYARTEMHNTLLEVDNALKALGGPYFLGSEFSMVDIMFTPFLERMAASLPYFKGFLVRDAIKYPHLTRWYEAMDSREAYQGIKSDYYTHCHDLPPQIGFCDIAPEGQPYVREIDGGVWDVTIPATSCMEPMIPFDADTAKRDAVRNILRNHEAIVQFASRGAGKPGNPPVNAPLADPNAVPNINIQPIVDISLRHICFAMLHDVNDSQNSLPLSQGLANSGLTASLEYLRDRVGVPRDMSVHGARQLRSHINWFLKSIS